MLRLVLVAVLLGLATPHVPQEPLVFGIFIGSIEEGARVFSPVRLLPLDHVDADGHEFPNPPAHHASEVEALVHIGEQSGLRLRATLQRYPQRPLEEWPYPEFTPPPMECIRHAPVQHVSTEAALPGLRALAVLDGDPLVFIVDTRGLTLAERQMDRITSMGLDLTRAQFLERLGTAIPRNLSPGCHILLYAGKWSQAP